MALFLLLLIPFLAHILMGAHLMFHGMGLFAFLTLIPAALLFVPRRWMVLLQRPSRPLGARMGARGRDARHEPRLGRPPLRLGRRHHGRDRRLHASDRRRLQPPARSPLLRAPLTDATETVSNADRLHAKLGATAPDSALLFPIATRPLTNRSLIYKIQSIWPRKRNPFASAVFSYLPSPPSRRSR